MAKDTFILYTEQKEVIDKLSDEQAGKLIKAIYEYVETGEMPSLDNVLDLVIIPFKQNLDRNADKYEETKKKRSEAGKLGAEIKKQKQAKQANAKFVNNKQANQAVNVNDNVNVNVNDNVNDNNNNVVVGDSCVDGLQEIIKFYNENIGLITPYGLETLEDYAKEMPVDLIILAMKKAVEADKRTIQYIKGILNNWSKKGIKTVLDAEKEDEQFKKNNKKQTKTEPKLDQRNYTEEELNGLYANLGGNK